MSRRVIAICIEVAGPDWMERWLAEGWMPNLAALRMSGGWTMLRSVADISSGSIWPSFTTGLMPARHGQFFTHMQLESGSYRVVKKYADDLPGPPFWAALARAGKKAAIIDVPQTRPLAGFEGVHVMGWGGEYPAWPRSSHLPALMNDILARFGPHPLAETRRIAKRPETLAECAQIKEDLLCGVRSKAGISRFVLDQGPFDLFLTVFAELHWAMHLLWDTLDPCHPEHDPERARRYASTFRDVLAEIDGFVGEARASCPDADILVFSLSGMGPNFSGWHLLPEVLKRLAVGPPDTGLARTASPLCRWGPHALRRLDSMVPARWIEAVKAAVPDRRWDRLTRRLDRSMMPYVLRSKRPLRS
ncbi:MAG TPA: alkaline phosphatase family protein [Geminicoccus sp.]|jgi:predicted AlkP superfamily phosphohydrolase/phosphomutase|uniref:alkaline phosphatase family protein n=1 Tax=Geminicoccus sp. TaxID=2024832 RepID=UPI002E334E2A|nr:alkaline phosphatase family protein [Geminicoccus sp.]HEX2525483.1 alkaline phosphatase family protein [Geminicoccus sp.]